MFGTEKYEICVSESLALSTADTLSVSVNRLYLHPKGGRNVWWNNASKIVVCSCDLDLDLLSEGKKQLPSVLQK